MPSRPRVLVVGQGPPVTGGIPSFVTRLVSDPSLRERADVTFLNTSRQTGKRPGALTTGNLGDALRDAWRLLRLGRRFDIVHLNVAAAPTLPLLRALVLTLAARASGASVILHAHTGRMDRAAASRAYRVLLGMAGRAASVVAVVSRRAESVAARHVASPVRVENGIDVEAYAGGDKRLPPLVTFVGTVSERKGLIDLRDALARLRAADVAFRATIVGDGRQEGPGAEERVRRAYADAGLGDVRFTGALSHDDVVRMLRESAVFCLPSHWEGFPLSLLEAMAASCAVVATAVGDVPEIVGDAGIVVPSGDVDGLSDALLRVCSNDERRAALGAAARRRVEERFSWDRTVRALSELYERYSM